MNRTAHRGLSILVLGAPAIVVVAHRLLGVSRGAALLLLAVGLPLAALLERRRHGWSSSLALALAAGSILPLLAVEILPGSMRTGLDGLIRTVLALAVTAALVRSIRQGSLRTSLAALILWRGLLHLVDLAAVSGLERWPFTVEPFSDGLLARSAGDLALTAMAGLLLAILVRWHAPSPETALKPYQRLLAGGTGLLLVSHLGPGIIRLADWLVAHSGREWWSPWSVAQGAGDLLVAGSALGLVIAILSLVWPAGRLLRWAVGESLPRRVLATGAALTIQLSLSARLIGLDRPDHRWPTLLVSGLLAAVLLRTSHSGSPGSGPARVIVLATAGAMALLVPLRHAALHQQTREHTELARMLIGPELQGARTDLVRAAGWLEEEQADCLAEARTDGDLAVCVRSLAGRFDPPVGLELFDPQGRLQARWLPDLPPPPFPRIPSGGSTAGGSGLALLPVRCGADTVPVATLLHRRPSGGWLRLHQNLLDRIGAANWPPDLAIRMEGSGRGFQAGRRLDLMDRMEPDSDLRVTALVRGEPGSPIASVTIARLWPTRAERMVDLVLLAVVALPGGWCVIVLGSRRRFLPPGGRPGLRGLTLPLAVGTVVVLSTLVPFLGLAHELATAQGEREEERFELQVQGAAVLLAEALRTLPDSADPTELRAILDSADRTFALGLALVVPGQPLVTRPPIPDVRAAELTLEGYRLRLFEPAPPDRRRRPPPGPVIALAVSLVVLMLSLSIAQRVLQPVSRLRRSVEAISEGRRPLEPTGISAGGEVGVMVRAVDTMINHLADSQQELRRERRLLGRILERLEAGVLVLDQSGRIGLTNPALERLLGQTPRTGTEVLPLLTGSGLPELARSLEEILSAGPAERGPIERHVEERSPVLSRDFRLTAAPLPGGESAEGGWVVLLEDLSRVLAGARLRTLELVTRDYAHEVGNRIGVIRLRLDGLLRALGKRPIDPERGSRHREVILRNLEALGAQRDDLRERLRFLRDPPGSLGRQDLRELVRSAVRDEGLEAEEGIRLVREEPEEALWIMAHRPTMTGAIRNVLRNARQALSGGTGTIRIRLDRTEDRVRLRITDSGSGIPPELLLRIFQEDITTKAQGTGFGLHAAFLFVGLHGGGIHAANAPPEGAELTILLPPELSEETG